MLDGQLIAEAVPPFAVYEISDQHITSLHSSPAGARSAEDGEWPC